MLGDCEWDCGGTVMGTVRTLYDGPAMGTVRKL